MKNIKKFLSLLLVLAMVFAMSSSVFATEATSSGTVTVSVTYNKFTKGGIDANGNAVTQAYKGGTPTMADANANYYILNYEMSIDDIKELRCGWIGSRLGIQCSVWPSGQCAGCHHCGILQS